MKKTIRDFDLNNKKVIIRCDFNIPVSNNEIIDDNRIKSSLKTINYAVNSGAKVILMSHLGKIKDEKDKKHNSLKIVADYLKNIYGRKLFFSKYTKGKELETKIENLKNGEILLIENTRFEDVPDNMESNCNLKLAKYWASLADIFINDAFGTIHRKHASNYGISKYLDSGVGFLVEKELQELNSLNNPQAPYAIIMGGAKVSDKIKLIEHLLPKVDYLLIGGGMAYTFLKSMGEEIGISLCEDDQITYCKELLKKYKDKIVLPIDSKVSSSFANNKPKTVDKILPSQMALDIGPKTIKLFSKYIKQSKTIFWNGPLGMYEFSYYQDGCKKILKSIKNSKAISILGGGDIVACAKKFNYIKYITFASTGGGATLEYLSGNKLPGLENIKEK